MQNFDLTQQTNLIKSPFLYEELSSKIIGLAYEVMNELGVGFLESVYHKSLEIALSLNKLKVRSEVPLGVTFRGFDVGQFRADLIVENKAQVINYLAASGLPVGLIINFGQYKV